MTADMVPAPRPAEDGAQVVGSPGGDDRPVTKLPSVLVNENVPDVLQGLATTNPRAFGTGVFPQFLAATYSQLANQLDGAQGELKEVRRELGRVNADLQTAKVDKARLEERIASLRQQRVMRSACAGIGAVLCSVGPALGQDVLLKYKIMLWVAGFALVVVSWFLGNAPKEKGP